MTKQTSQRVSSLAARILKGHKPSEAEIMILAASCLSQDETPPWEEERTWEELRMAGEGGTSELSSDFIKGRDISKETDELYEEKN